MDEDALGLGGELALVVQATPGEDLAPLAPGVARRNLEWCQQRRGSPVADRQRPGHRTQADQDIGEPEQLVEELGDHAAVHTRRRPLVGVVKGDAPSELTLAALALDRPHLHGRRNGVGEADHRAGREVVLGVQPGKSIGARHVATLLRPRGGRFEGVRDPCDMGRRLVQVVVLEWLPDGHGADAPHAPRRPG